MLFSNFGLNDNDQNTLLKNGFSLLAAKTDCDTLIILEPGIPVKSIQFDSVEVAIDLAENFADMPLSIVSIDGQLHELSIELLDYYSEEFDLEWKPEQTERKSLSSTEQAVANGQMIPTCSPQFCKHSTLTDQEIENVFGLSKEDQKKMTRQGFVIMAVSSFHNVMLIHSSQGVTGVEYRNPEMAMERSEFFSTCHNTIIVQDGKIHQRSTDWLIVFKDPLNLNYGG